MAGRRVWPVPARITPEDVATAGAPLAAIQPRDQAMYVSYVGKDGAIWLTYEVDDGPWTDGNAGPGPIRVSPQTQVSGPGAHRRRETTRRSRSQCSRWTSTARYWMTSPDAQGKWRDGDSGRLPTQVSS